MQIKLLIIILTIISLIPACSTPPKNPGDVFDIRKQAETHLELGSKDADRGSFETALLKLDEAMKLAIAVDDPGLRIRVGLSRGNVLFSLGRGEEAKKAWEDALLEAKRAGNKELEAVSSIYVERGKLLSATDVDLSAVAQAVRDKVSGDMSAINDRYYTAFAWTIIGLAENKLKNYKEAETAVLRALEIHEKDLYFELAAYDWFMIASFRSRARDYSGALKALEKAIDFDRRVENSWGLASDWQAVGDVHGKAGNAEESSAAYARAAEIFNAIGNLTPSREDKILLRAAEIFDAIGNSEAAAKARSLAENGPKP
jgi:tetratricopeptide (TPR) repeat protein